MLITNAFSLNMLGGAQHANVEVTQVTSTYAAEMLRADGVESAVGHADTAAIIAADLGIEVPANRASLTLAAGTTLVVAQYTGPRLPEGATLLPEGAALTYYLVEVSE